jgi:hypothetical protein
MQLFYEQSTNHIAIAPIPYGSAKGGSEPTG